MSLITTLANRSVFNLIASDGCRVGAVIVVSGEVAMPHGPGEPSEPSEIPGIPEGLPFRNHSGYKSKKPPPIKIEPNKDASSQKTTTIDLSFSDLSYSVQTGIFRRGCLLFVVVVVVVVVCDSGFVVRDPEVPNVETMARTICRPVVAVDRLYLIKTNKWLEFEYAYDTTVDKEMNNNTTLCRKLAWKIRCSIVNTETRCKINNSSYDS